MNSLPAVTRRTVLSAGFVALAASSVGVVSAPDIQGLNTPAERFRAYLLMRAALNEQLVIGFLSGRYYGVVDAEITPLYGVVSATFARYRARSDGAYEGVSYEVPFFTDLDTGRALDRWRNPYTQEMVDVPHMKFPSSTLVINPDLEIVLPKPAPGLSMQHRVVTPLISNQDLWMTEVTTSSMTTTPAQQPVKYNEIVTLHSSLAALNKSDATRVPCQTAYTSVVSWRPWLKMGERAGHLMGNGAGAYGATLDQLPESWRTAAAERRPEVLKDPASPL